MPFLPLFTGIRHLVLSVSPTKACLLCATPAGMDWYIQAMPLGIYRVQSPGFPKIVYYVNIICYVNLAINEFNEWTYRLSDVAHAGVVGSLQEESLRQHDQLGPVTDQTHAGLIRVQHLTHTLPGTTWDSHCVTLRGLSSGDQRQTLSNMASDNVV